MLDIYTLAGLHLHPRRDSGQDRPDTLWLLGLGERIAGLWSAERRTVLVPGWSPMRPEGGYDRDADRRPLASV